MSSCDKSSTRTKTHCNIKVGNNHPYILSWVDGPVIYKLPSNSRLFWHVYYQPVIDRAIICIIHCILHTWIFFCRPPSSPSSPYLLFRQTWLIIPRWQQTTTSPTPEPRAILCVSLWETLRDALYHFIHQQELIQREVICCAGQPCQQGMENATGRVFEHWYRWECVLISWCEGKVNRKDVPLSTKQMWPVSNLFTFHHFVALQTSANFK